MCVYVGGWVGILCWGEHKLLTFARVYACMYPRGVLYWLPPICIHTYIYRCIIYTVYIYLHHPVTATVSHTLHTQTTFSTADLHPCHPSIQPRYPLNGSEGSLRKTTMPLICILLGDSNMVCACLLFVYYTLEQDTITLYTG